MQWTGKNLLPLNSNSKTHLSSFSGRPRCYLAEGQISESLTTWISPNSGELTGSSLDLLPDSTAPGYNSTCWSSLLWALSCMNSTLLQCYSNGSLNGFYKHNYFYSVSTCPYCCTVLPCSANKPGLLSRTSLGNTLEQNVCSGWSSFKDLMSWSAHNFSQWSG